MNNLSLSFNFSNFLINTGVVKVGDFTLKSGKKSDIFFNFGEINSGKSLLDLGMYYATYINFFIGTTLKKNFINNQTALFGPAYKGINIALATSIAFYRKYNISVPFIYDRKNVKNYGEVSSFVGISFDNVKNVIILDDVLTTADTKYEIISKIPENISIDVIVGVDRQEVDENNVMYSNVFKEKTGIKLYSITNKKDLLKIYNYR